MFPSTPFTWTSRETLGLLSQLITAFMQLRILMARVSEVNPKNWTCVCWTRFVVQGSGCFSGPGCWSALDCLGLQLIVLLLVLNYRFGVTWNATLTKTWIRWRTDPFVLLCSDPTKPTEQNEDSHHLLESIGGVGTGISNWLNSSWQPNK